MRSTLEAGDFEITSEALRALAEWTHTFGGKLRQSVARLASQSDSGLPESTFPARVARPMSQIAAVGRRIFPSFGRFSVRRSHVVTSKGMTAATAFDRQAKAQQKAAAM